MTHMDISLLPEPLSTHPAWFRGVSTVFGLLLGIVRVEVDIDKLFFKK